MGNSGDVLDASECVDVRVGRILNQPLAEAGITKGSSTLLKECCPVHNSWRASRYDWILSRVFRCEGFPRAE